MPRSIDIETFATMAADRTVFPPPRDPVWPPRRVLVEPVRAPVPVTLASLRREIAEVLNQHRYTMDRYALRNARGVLYCRAPLVTRLRQARQHLRTHPRLYQLCDDLLCKHLRRAYAA